MTNQIFQSIRTDALISAALIDDLSRAYATDHVLAGLIGRNVLEDEAAAECVKVELRQLADQKNGKVSTATLVRTIGQLMLLMFTPALMLASEQPMQLSLPLGDEPNDDDGYDQSVDTSGDDIRCRVARQNLNGGFEAGIAIPADVVDALRGLDLLLCDRKKFVGVIAERLKKAGWVTEVYVCDARNARKGYLMVPTMRFRQVFEAIDRGDPAPQTGWKDVFVAAFARTRSQNFVASPSALPAEQTEAASRRFGVTLPEFPSAPRTTSTVLVMALIGALATPSQELHSTDRATMEHSGTEFLIADGRDTLRFLEEKLPRMGPEPMDPTSQFVSGLQSIRV